MKKFFALVVCICIVSAASAQLLYKVSGNGLEKPSYLFGTHHLAPITILDSIPGFETAFNSTSRVVGELNMSEMMSPDAMQLMQKSMFIDNDTTLNMLLTPEEFAIVNKFAKENMMVDLEMAQKLKPSFINNNVAMVVYMKHNPGFNPQEQLDMYLQQKGTEQGKKVGAFETMEFQLNLLFNSQSLKRQAELLVCSLIDEERSFDEMKRLTEGYMAQNLNALHELSLERLGNNCDPLPGEMEAMTDERNKRWVETLPAMMKESPVFVAVGALHLSGENGLIELLKKQGYTVEAVQ